MTGNWLNKLRNTYTMEYLIARKDAHHNQNNMKLPHFKNYFKKRPTHDNSRWQNYRLTFLFCWCVFCTVILYHFYIMKKIFFHKFTHRGPFIVPLNGIFIQWNTNKAHPRMPIQRAQLNVHAPTFKSLPPTAQRVFSGQATASCSSPVPPPTLITGSGNQGVSQHLHSPTCRPASSPSPRAQHSCGEKCSSEVGDTMISSLLWVSTGPGGATPFPGGQYQHCPGAGLHLVMGRAKGPAEGRRLNQIPSHQPETCHQFLRARCKAACPPESAPNTRARSPLGEALAWGSQEAVPLTGWKCSVVSSSVDVCGCLPAFMTVPPPQSVACRFSPLSEVNTHNDSLRLFRPQDDNKYSGVWSYFPSTPHFPSKLTRRSNPATPLPSQPFKLSHPDRGGKFTHTFTCWGHTKNFPCFINIHALS